MKFMNTIYTITGIDFFLCIPPRISSSIILENYTQKERRYTLMDYYTKKKLSLLSNHVNQTEYG